MAIPRAGLCPDSGQDTVNFCNSQKGVLLGPGGYSVPSHFQLLVAGKGFHPGGVGWRREHSGIFTEFPCESFAFFL